MNEQFPSSHSHSHSHFFGPSRATDSHGARVTKTTDRTKRVTRTQSAHRHAQEYTGALGQCYWQWRPIRLATYRVRCRTSLPRATTSLLHSSPRSCRSSHASNITRPRFRPPLSVVSTASPATSLPLSKPHLCPPLLTSPHRISYHLTLLSPLTLALVLVLPRLSTRRSM